MNPRGIVKVEAAITAAAAAGEASRPSIRSELKAGRRHAPTTATETHAHTCGRPLNTPSRQERERGQWSLLDSRRHRRGGDCTRVGCVAVRARDI